MKKFSELWFPIAGVATLLISIGAIRHQIDTQQSEIEDLQRQPVAVVDARLDEVAKQLDRIESRLDARDR